MEVHGISKDRSVWIGVGGVADELVVPNADGLVGFALWGEDRHERGDEAAIGGELEVLDESFVNVIRMRKLASIDDA